MCVLKLYSFHKLINNFMYISLPSSSAVHINYRAKAEQNKSVLVPRLGVQISCLEDDEWESMKTALVRSDPSKVIPWWYMLNTLQLQISQQIPPGINTIVPVYGGGDWGPWWRLPARQIKFSHWIPVRISVSGKLLKNSFPLSSSIEGTKIILES